MLLNRATDKLNHHLEQGNKDYDLVRELDDDDANVSLKLKQPLYRTLFPEWGRITAHEYLNSKAYVPPIKLMKKRKMQHIMFMAYFKPLNLCVFALVSEIVLFHVEQSGNKKVYVQVASHRISASNEFIPTCLEVALHKVTGKLLVCLAVQSSRQSKDAAQYDHYVIVN